MQTENLPSFHNDVIIFLDYVKLLTDKKQGSTYYM